MYGNPEDNSAWRPPTQTELAMQYSKIWLIKIDWFVVFFCFPDIMFIWIEERKIQ